MRGKLWGIGVGPGEPELLTLKSVRLINESEVIAVPRDKGKNNVALNIVKSVIDISNKEILYLEFPMTKDREVLKTAHSNNAEVIINILNSGRNIGFITLGDVSIYSTFSYVQTYIEQKGFEVEICPGVPSFCAIGAKMKVSLTSMEKPLHIIPAKHVDVKEHINLRGTKVFMKSGKDIKRIYDCVKDDDNLLICGISNCGMENEKIIEDFETDEEQGYFTTIVVREKE